MRLNILLLLGSLKCIIKVWKRPRTASMALRSRSHSWTTTTSHSLPMVMVGMIKSLMSSVFTIQFKREGSQIARRLYSHQNTTADKHILFVWLKSNYRLRAGMILPYSRITMTLNMSQFYHRSPYYIQRGINGKSGDRITETHLMVSDWGPGSFLLQLLSSLFCFFHFQPLTWLQGCVGLLVDPPNIKYLNSYWMDCLKLCTDICSPRRIKPADFGAPFNTSCNATSRSNQQKSSEISQHPQTDRYNLVQTSIVPRRWRHWSPLILPPPIRRSTFVVEYCNIWVAMKFHTDIHTSLGINCCTFHGSWTPPSVITGSKV